MLDLIQVFNDADVWCEILNKAADKSISQQLLQELCIPAMRSALLSRIESGDYVISPPSVVKIPKDNGKLREIYVNKSLDRVILSLINYALSQLYADKLSSACKAYLAGSSCAKAVQEVAKQSYAFGYKLDLSKYFDSVPREIINKALSELSTGTALDSILFNYYNDDTVLVSGKPVTRFKSLAQGCAVAAFLSNYVLREVDAVMQSMCSYYCRYSDDMILLGDKESVDRALAVLNQMLSDLGLSLNPDKIECITPDREFKFLGYGLKGQHITISQKDFIAKKKEVKHTLKCIKRKANESDAHLLKRCVKAVKNVFYCKQNPCYSWAYSKARAVNDLARVAELDNYTKEQLRAKVTGCQNYTTNMHKVSAQMLEQAGHVSLVHMFKMAQTSRDLYEMEFQRCVRQTQLH